MKRKINVLGKKSVEQLNRVYKCSKETISQHLWLELLFMVVLAACVAGIVFLSVSHFIYSLGFGNYTYESYAESRAYIQDAVLERAAWVNESTSDIGEDEIETAVAHIINESFNMEYVSASQTYLVESSGNVIYPKGIIESLNINKAIERANNSGYSNNQDKFIGIYPVIIGEQVCYLYNESSLVPVSHREFSNIGNVLAIIASIAVFVVIIFRLTRDKIAYIEYLSSCLGQISKGNLDYEIEVVGNDELARVAQSITHMEDELKYQIDAKIATEKSKNELVTNVAHDLRTPLTSIIGYIGLVKMNTKSDDETHKYLEIAFNKAEKLKMIIEDLFELTKLHQGSVVLKRENISLSNLLHQLIEELMPLAQDKNIEVESYIDTSHSTISVDVAKITRVFENLIENAIKYSSENETIYVELRGTADKVYIAVSNPSSQVSQEEINKYFERFYRADQSRTSTGGSGLGLAIAKNIVELHGGTIEAKLHQDLLCFKVILPRINLNR